ncbi:DNA methylase N-4/N-6 [Mannheimia indoligenes]|uniref:DNA methylase N-4/N-6 n=1 Tax=Mannheimia indoligenes TaxID=3103145 RepID=UPI002FE5B961
MTILTWYGKEEAVKKAKQTPYCLLRELPDFSHNIARQPTAQLLLKPYLMSSKI